MSDFPTANTAKPDSSTRAPYATPSLIDYGKICDLTAAGSGPQTEFNMNNMPTRRP